jgi:hypothetical protein
MEHYLSKLDVKWKKNLPETVISQNQSKEQTCQIFLSRVKLLKLYLLQNMKCSQILGIK